MTPEQQQAQITKNNGLKTLAQNQATLLKDVFEKAGFMVKVGARGPQGDFPRHFLDVAYPGVDFERNVSVEVISGRWDRNPAKVQVEYARGGYGRNRRTRYTVLDSIDTRLLERLQEDLEMAKASQVARDQSKLEQAKAIAQRDAELNGVVLPPGMEAKIITGNGPGAGMYRVGFSRYGGQSITDTNLTAEQVKELVALLNKFQKTDELYVITGSHDSEGGDKVVRFYRQGDWISSMHSGPGLYTKEEAERLLPEARAKAPWAMNAVVASYTAVAAIPSKLTILD